MNEKIRWKAGSNYKGVKASDAHAKIEEIRARNGGNYTPADIVEEAKNKKSPLHKCGFTWDVRKAAQERWEDQARRLVRSIEIVRIEDDGAKTHTPVYVSIAQPYVKGPCYASTAEAMNDPVSRDLIVRTARAVLDGFQKRYGKLYEFAEVVRAIEALPKPQVA